MIDHLANKHAAIQNVFIKIKFTSISTLPPQIQASPARYSLLTQFLSPSGILDTTALLTSPAAISLNSVMLWSLKNAE